MALLESPFEWGQANMGNYLILLTIIGESIGPTVDFSPEVGMLSNALLERSFYY